MFNRTFSLGALVLLITSAASAQSNEDTSGNNLRIVTASNTPNNQLLVYNATGTLLKSISTTGQGGVAGNSGGIAQGDGLLAVVNYGSSNVSVFNQGHRDSSLKLKEVVPTISKPVSVAFGNDHLYILTTIQVQSYPIYQNWVGKSPDGVASLIMGDGSAGQVGVVDGQLIITEKSNAIETVNLDSQGQITGNANMVANIPSNVNVPLGLVTRGNNAYVTIAHADEISLVRNSDVLTVVPSAATSTGMQQHAPCWLALDGPFLFSANSPSKSVSRYAVYGQKIVPDAAIAAQFNGSPTDIAYNAGLAAVIDNNGVISHVSVFKVDEDGNLTLNGSATINSPATNGIAIVRQQNEISH